MVIKTADFLMLTGGKPTLSAQSFVRDYIVNQKQSALCFRFNDPKNGIYPLLCDIDLDFDGKVKFDEKVMREKHIETAQHMAGVLRQH